MRKSFSVACLFVLVIGAFIGCKATDKTEEAANSSLQPNAVPQSGTASEPEKTPRQYMAVCLTKEEHEGYEYILTKWLDTKYNAQIYGREHARKKKGHNVVYNERVKP